MKLSFDSIAITGYSAVTAAGTGISPILDLLHSGTGALSPVPDDCSGGRELKWGRATAFKASEFIPPLKARKMDRCSQFAVAAAGLALKDAGIDLKALDPERVGIALGCGFGGVGNSAEFLSGYFSGGPDGAAPLLFPNTVANASASNASIEHGLKGPNVTLVQRFCSAESAFLMACRFIEEGRADVMLTGGVDDLMPLMIEGFAATGQLSRYAAAFGEGCGILVLERLDHAVSRQAAIRGRAVSLASVGLLAAGHEEAGMSMLLEGVTGAGLVSLSGVAGELFSPFLPNGMRTHETAPLVGRSLAMGGTSMAVLLASLSSGESGCHLGASPEGPYYAIRFSGGI